MRPRLSRLLAALCLLLGLASLVLWGVTLWRSFFVLHADYVSTLAPQTTRGVFAEWGIVGYQHSVDMADWRMRGWDIDGYGSDGPAAGDWFYVAGHSRDCFGRSVGAIEVGLLGFGLHHYVSTAYGVRTRVHLPLWFTALFPAYLAYRLHRRARRLARPPTACPTCAYDLRAHHPGDRCPECGTPIAPDPKADA